MREETDKGSDASCGGHECRSGHHNRFFPSKQMGVEEYEIEQDYLIGRRRLINRTVLGRGIVCGFAVDGARKAAEHRPEVPPRAIEVERGLALDRNGREVVLQEKVTIGTRNTFLFDKGDGGCRVRSLDKLKPGHYLLSVHYAEHPFGAAHLPKGCGCGRPEKKFVCETVVFSLRPLEDGPCPQDDHDCERKCRCPEGKASSPSDRGRHHCLCQWTAAPCFPRELERLCEWHHHWIDPRDAVPLACVLIARIEDECEPLLGWITDDCGPRRLLKGNEFLYDLIRGCDLTRIEHITWEPWHRRDEPVSWDTFAGVFHDDGDPEAAAIETDWAVRFTGPVQIETLRPDAVVMTAFTKRSEEWLIGRRVPIVHLDPEPQPSGDAIPEGMTNRFRICVSKRWWEDNVKPGGGSWLEEPSHFEIEVRGDLILDCHGQAVDADAIGMTAAPSGNGTPGGTYLSTFSVAERPGSPEKEAE